MTHPTPCDDCWAAPKGSLDCAEFDPRGCRTDEDDLHMSRAIAEPLDPDSAPGGHDWLLEQRRKDGELA